jgi:hypothetical protein
MTKPFIRIHDLETDEVIDREMTAAEFKVYEANRLKELAIETETEKKALDKIALLEKLGLTAEEAALLLG